MALENLATNLDIPSVIAGSAIGVILAAGIFLAVILSLAVYIYVALAWMKIAKEMNHKHPWLAWIPIANVAMIFQLGKFHWAWIFLMLVPVLGWLAIGVLAIISTWRIFEKRKYPGWFSLAGIIPKIGGILYLIALGFVAWKKKK